MAVPLGKRSQLIKDIVHDRVILNSAENDLRRAMKRDAAGSNAGAPHATQAEAVLTVVEIVGRMMTALAAINSDLEPFTVGDRTLEIRAGDTTIILEQTGSIVLTTGEASIRMLRDGTITLKGKNFRLDGSGDINIKASKELVLKGYKIMQN